MSRTFKIDGPGKVRNQLMRTCAEVIRRLSQKTTLDDEAKDMAALLVFCLRQIADGIDESAMAWEKRDYWIKAERFREKWSWAGGAAADLEAVIRDEAWDRLPANLAQLYHRFNEVTVSKFTRKSSLWKGAYARLRAETPSGTPPSKKRV